MNKITGYILGILGLVVIILSLNTSKIKFLASIKPAYLMIAGFILVILGVVLLMGKGKVKQAEEEVPIYKGKKIIGYRRAK